MNHVKNDKKIRKLALALGLSLAALASAHADIATPLVGLQEKVINDADGNWLINQYVITNNFGNKENHLHAFGVTNPVAMPISTTLEGWSSITLSRNEWNAGWAIKGLGDEDWSVWYTGAQSLYDESSEPHVGSFESLFGTGDNYVNFYYGTNGKFIGLLGDTSDEFFFSAPSVPPAFEYAAFDRHGRVTFQSFNVPEPGSVLLVGLALLGLAGTRRRSTRSLRMTARSS